MAMQKIPEEMNVLRIQDEYTLQDERNAQEYGIKETNKVYE